MVARKKGMLILFIILGVLVVLGGAFTALYFSTDLFKKPEKLFFKYFLMNDSIFEMVDDKTFVGILEKSTQNPYESKVELTARAPKDEDDLINKIKLEVNTKSDSSNDKQNTEIVLKYNDLNLFNMKYKQQGDLYGINADEVIPGVYLAAKNENLKTFAKKINPDSDASNFVNKISFNNIPKVFEISEGEKENFYNLYTQVIKNEVPDTAFTKEKQVKIQLDGVEYTTTAYKLTIGYADGKNLLIKALETLKQDSITLNLLVSKYKLIEGDEQINLDTINKIIDQYISQLKEIKADNNDKLTITTYAYKDQLLKTDVEYTEIVEKIKFETSFGFDSEEEEKTNKEPEYARYNVKIEVANKIEGAVQTLNILKQSDDLSERYIITREKSTNETTYNLNYSQDGEQYILASLTNTGNEASDNFLQELEVKIFVGDDKKEGYNINCKKSTTFKDSVETKNLEDDSYLVLNDCSKEQLEQVFKLVVERANVVLSEKMKLLEIVE